MEPIGDNQAVPDNLDELERKFFVKNVMESENQEDLTYEMDSDFSIDEDFAHLEEEEMFEQMAGTVVENPEDWSSVLTQQRPKNNTGGKGVLADHEEATKITKRRNETRVLKQREAWKRQGYGSRNIQLKSETNVVKSGKGDDEEEADDDDEFFEKFRAMRMQQISSVSSLPQFGQLKSVGKFEFVDEVDQADPRTFVVVHIYEDYILACQRMNAFLSSLAKRFPHVKFLSLKATEADQTLSHAMLPAFLVYKSGKVVGRAAVDTAKKEFQNEKFTEDDVEWMLASKYGVHLPGVDVNDKERAQNSKDDSSDLRRGVVAEY